MDLFSETSSPETHSSPSDQMLALGLRGCAEEAGWGADRLGLQRLADRIEQGGSVEEILQSGKLLPLYLNEIVREGIKSDRFPLILEEYLRTSRQRRMLWRSFYRSLIYPMVIFIFAVILVSAFTMLVGVGFRDMFNDFGIELPALTLFVMSVAEFISGVGVIYWLGLIFFFPALLLLHWWLPGRAERVNLLQLIPIVGSARRYAGAAEFCSRLSVLVDSEIPLPRCLEIMSLTMRDRSLRSTCRKIQKQLESGMSPQEIPRETTGLSGACASAFRWSRDPKTFAEGLRALSYALASQAEVRVAQMAIFTEPVMFVVVGFLIGGVVIAGFFPLIKLLNDLS